MSSVYMNTIKYYLICTPYILSSTSHTFMHSKHQKYDKRDQKKKEKMGLTIQATSVSGAKCKFAKYPNGAICCVSYNNTMSTVATANNMRWCNPSNIAYCLLNSYVGTEPFVSYCSVLCNFCKPTTTNPTTVKNNNVTVSSITTAQSLSNNTTPYVCQDMDPEIFSSFPTSYCLTISYIGKKPYAEFCQKTCNFCKSCKFCFFCFFLNFLNYKTLFCAMTWHCKTFNFFFMI